MTARPPATCTSTDPHSQDLRSLTRLTGFAALLVAILLGLVASAGRLPGPPSPSPATWSTWIVRVGPAPALIRCVCLIGILIAGYLLVVVAIELVGRATGLPHVLALARSMSAPAVRRLMGTVAGVAMAASITVSGIGPASSAGSPVGAVAVPTSTVPGPALPDPALPDPADVGSAGVAVMQALDPEGVASSPESRPPIDSDPTLDPSADAVPIMRVLADSTPGSSLPATPTSPTSVMPSTPSGVDDTAPMAPVEGGDVDRSPGSPGSPGSGGPAGAGDVAPAPPGGQRSWVIERGDHLWGVARRTLADSRPRPPTDAEIARYLDDLIETNLDVLVVPGDADLVFVGQEFVLPPVPPA